MLLLLILSTDKKEQCSFLEHMHFLLLHEKNSSHFTKQEYKWVNVKKVYTENLKKKNWRPTYKQEYYKIISCWDSEMNPAK